MTGPAEPGDGPPPTGRSIWTVAALAAAGVVFAVGSFLLLRYQAAQPPKLNGDGWEYWYMAESFHRHGTPELYPEDKVAVDAEAIRAKVGTAPVPPYAYMKSPEGKWFGVHFWAYSLSTVPAKMYLEWAGASGLGGLCLANAAWFVLALGVTLFASSAPASQRVALAALAASGPVVWYIAWTGAEMFSWALVLVAVSAYRDRRYAWAAAAAGLAATQNSPIILFGGVAVLAALLERRWRVAALAAAGAAIGLIPYAFFQYHYGHPNLIVIGEEYVGVRNLSWARTWGSLTDPNQGLLPYVPVLVFGLAVGTARLVYTRNVRGLLLAAGGLGVAVGTQVAHNWNSGCEGLQRYLVWMIPLAAGVVVEGVGGARRLWALAAVVVLAHTYILIAYERSKALADGYLNHTLVARWVLDRYPWAYWPDHEVFVERGQHSDGWPFFPADFPIVYARPDGTVSKMLLGPEHVEKVGERFDTDPSYLVALREQASRESGLFYAHPPGESVRVRKPTP